MGILLIFFAVTIQNAKFRLYFSVTGCILSTILMGPSNMLPDNIILMAIGTALNGFAGQILVICSNILAVNALNEKYPSNHQ